MTPVKEAKTTETTLEVLEGTQFDRGDISPYFIAHTEMSAYSISPRVIS
jgi:chaperonin GroEL